MLFKIIEKREFKRNYKENESFLYNIESMYMDKFILKENYEFLSILKKDSVLLHRYILNLNWLSEAEEDYFGDDFYDFYHVNHRWLLNFANDIVDDNVIALYMLLLEAEMGNFSFTSRKILEKIIIAMVNNEKFSNYIIFFLEEDEYKFLDEEENC